MIVIITYFIVSIQVDLDGMCVHTQQFKYQGHWIRLIAEPHQTGLADKSLPPQSFI